MITAYLTNKRAASDKRMTTQKLSEDFRADLRYFAFYIGNGSLEPADSSVDYIPYDACLNQPGPLLGELFAVYLNTYQAQLNGLTKQDPQQRAAQFLAQQCLPHYTASLPLASWELMGSDGSATSIDTIKSFAAALSHGAMASEILANLNYHESLVEYGSFLEMIFAIFANVLELDADGRVVNTAYAQRRAAQYIRQYCDPAYQVIPPFAAWETELL